MIEEIIDTPAGTTHVVFTDAADGDFAVVDPAADVDLRRRQLLPHPLTSLRQVHGTTTLVVSEPGEHDLAEADAAVTFASNCVVGVTTADCAPVVLVADIGVAVIHAGWRGAAAGVIESAARLLAERGARPVRTLVGPCIQPGAYEFDEQDLARLAGSHGADIAGSTEWGTPALDLHEMVASIVEGCGWPRPERSPCTSSERYFSHRTRGDRQRLLTAAWIERP